MAGSKSLIRSEGGKVRRVVVVGGGLLGLEAAQGLADLGASVTVLHLFDTLMNQQLDKTGGLTEALALADAAEAKGFSLMIGCMVGTSLAMAPATVTKRVPGVTGRNHPSGRSQRIRSSRLVPPATVATPSSASRERRPDRRVMSSTVPPAFWAGSP